MPDHSADSQILTDDDRRVRAAAHSLSFDRFVKILLLTAGYGLTGIVGLSLAIPPGYATAVWPASGIALAAILMWGPRVWPGIWIGSFLVNVAVAFTGTIAEVNLTSLLVAVSIAVGSTLQALVGGFVLQRWVGVERIFESGPTTFAFTGIAAACCTLAATWGVTTLRLAGYVDWVTYRESWQTWWLGDLIGVLVFAPVFLTWRQSLQVGRKPWRLVEVFGSFTLLAISTTVVFVNPSPVLSTASPLTFLPLPCLVWIACRFRPSGVALGVCMVSAIAVAATANSTGPFAGDSTSESLLLLQAFVGLTTVMALTLGAAVTGHRQSEKEFRSLSLEMEQLALSDELTGLRNRRGFLVLADQALRMARRSKAKCLLVFIDLDGLKKVNDTRGHAAGDAMIADAARVLNHVFRESDVVGRVGGDEFAIFALLDEHDYGKTTVAHRLQAEIDKFNAQAVRSMRISMSIGMEELPTTSDTPLDVLLARADQDMYEKKRRTNRDRKERR
ncbi:MAG: MASE1 domain-containing protein [Steroidobacteraceae bacterium]